MQNRSDYHYDLPGELIAQAPAESRDGSRLLVVDEHGLADRRFSDIVTLIPDNAVLVVNDTRVFPARLRTHKATGGAVELLFVEPSAEPVEPGGPGAEPGGHWRCMARSSKPLRPGTVLTVDHGGGLTVEIVTARGADSLVTVRVPGDVHELLGRHGAVPLPPYITRSEAPSGEDVERYQTVYARERGAVAAPTAGLHFTEHILERLRGRGVDIAAVTLHVGPGTFAPMRAERLDDHHMHSERYTIAPSTAAAIERGKRDGRPVIAVGTTCVRALESAALRARPGTCLAPGPASTELFIRPGFAFRVVDRLITNFHLPESTLLMLVAAFAGYGRTMAAYDHAVGAAYRFFSYGDAMLVSRAPYS